VGIFGAAVRPTLTDIKDLKAREGVASNKAVVARFASRAMPCTLSLAFQRKMKTLRPTIGLGS